jgi:pimeloyl-ACP methyl ester carboxylesterase
VWGISYGSHLGQMLVRVDPEGIKALVLDAIVPNDLGDLMRIHRWADRVLNNIFSTCDSGAMCRNLEERFYTALEAATERTITVELEDEEAFPAGEAVVPPLILGFAPFAMMYEQDEHPGIPATMNALMDLFEDADPELFKPLVQGGLGGGPSGFSPGMAAAIRCNDGYVHARAEVVAEDIEAFPRLGGLIQSVEGSRLLAETCEEAGLAPRDRSDYALVETDIPTLIVNGAWDPVTPPPLAERIVPGFSDVRYIEVPYAGHGPTRSMSACSGEVLNAFFDEPRTNLDAQCFEDGVERPDYLNYFRTTAPVRAAGVALDGPQALLAPGLWLGSSLMVLVIAALAIPLGFFARLVDQVPAAEIKADMALTRWAAFLTALTALGACTLIGLGVYQAQEISEISLVAGFAPMARIGAWLILLGGVLGVITILMMIRRLVQRSLRVGSILGLLATGAAAISLVVFSVQWDLMPF